MIVTAGQYDVMAEVICRDTEHFTDLVNERMHHIDGITSTESFFVLEVHKLAYGWVSTRSNRSPWTRQFTPSRS